MQDLGDNAYRCEKDETVTMTFKPTEPLEVKIEFSTDGGDTLKPVEDWELNCTVDDSRIDLHVIYTFFPGSTSRCRIFLKGDKGGPSVEDRPPAWDRPRTPEHRIYSFFPPIETDQD